VSNAIVGAGFIDYPVYINSDDPISTMDFQFFFNNTEFEFDSIINVAGIEQVLGFTAPDVASGGFLEFRFTSNNLNTLFPNESVLVYIRFNTSSTCSSSVLLPRSDLQNGHVKMLSDLRKECTHPPQLLFPQHGKYSSRSNFATSSFAIAKS
jgi:hypothetical protein